ncbi:uncharacterized protein LOC109201142 [Oreochromis niloticus]|uniref:uncharacterized protein LOC109201142 n=1 Tax=Oreochromis niloticus TaxID=8128 RepID=UPI0009057219|nr:uncharacterized protein LOC109201142 [Oreochromis niloticus]
MATSTVMRDIRLGHKRSNVSHVPLSKRRKDEDIPAFPAAVSQFESANKGTCFSLKKPDGAILRKAELEDTVYKDYPADVNGWGRFYLPTTVTMQVVGIVEGISCLCDQLVLMRTREDQQVYAYDGEELHLVASSVKQLLDEGMEYPASKTYYKGEAFKDMTKKDWDQVWKSDVGRKLDEEHKSLVSAREPRLLDFMKSNKML